MLTITIASSNSTISFEYPEHVSHVVKGQEFTIDLYRVNEDGWRALLAKSRRFISDGSPDHATVLRKIDQLYGEGKPIGQRTSMAPEVREYAVLVTKRLVKDGHKVKDIPKLGTTIESVTTVAREYGIPASWLKKAGRRAVDIAALKAEDID